MEKIQSIMIFEIKKSEDFRLSKIKVKKWSQ